VQAEIEPFHALIRQRGVGGRWWDHSDALTCRHEQAPGAGGPLSRWEEVAPEAVLPGRDLGNRVLRGEAVLPEVWMRDR
jgi:hypothetical protein